MQSCKKYLVLKPKQKKYKLSYPLDKGLSICKGGGHIEPKTEQVPQDLDSLISHSWRLGNHQMAVGIDDFPRTNVFKAWPGRAS